MTVDHPLNRLTVDQRVLPHGSITKIENKVATKEFQMKIEQFTDANRAIKGLKRKRNALSEPSGFEVKMECFLDGLSLHSLQFEFPGERSLFKLRPIPRLVQ